MKLKKPKTILFAVLLCVIGVVYKSGIWKPLYYKYDYMQFGSGEDFSRARLSYSRFSSEGKQASMELYNTRTGFCESKVTPELEIYYDDFGKVEKVLFDNPKIEKLSPPWPLGIKDQSHPNPPSWVTNDALFKSYK